MPSVPVPSLPEAEQVEDFTWWYISLFVLSIGLAGAVFWWYSKKNAKKDVKTGKKKRVTKEESWEIGALDANKELEWLRKNHKAMGAMSSKKNVYQIQIYKCSGNEKLRIKRQRAIFTDSADFLD